MDEIIDLFLEEMRAAQAEEKGKLKHNSKKEAAREEQGLSRVQGNSANSGQRTSADDEQDAGGPDTDLEDEMEGSQDARLPSLEDMYLRSCKRYNVVPIGSFKFQAQNPQIRVTHLALKLNDMKALCTTLMRAETITSLDLTCNNFGVSGLQVLLEMLHRRPQLRELNISHNNLGSQGAQLLAAELPSAKQLRKLNISNNGFSEKDAQNIADVIQKCPALNWLNISGNSFSGNAGVLIGAAIGQNYTIEKLMMSWCDIRTRGALALSKALKENSNIDTLDLSWNGFSDAGVKPFSDVLATGCNLVKLDLSSNRIGLAGAVDLAKGLLTNESLEELVLNQNPITSKGAEQIIFAVRQNTNSKLKRLEMKSSSVTYSSAALLSDLPTPPLLRCDTFVRSHDSLTRQRTTLNDCAGEPIRTLDLYTRANQIQIGRAVRQHLAEQNGNANDVSEIEQEALKRALKRMPIPLNDTSIDKLVGGLEVNDSGKISLTSLESLTRANSTLEFDLMV